MIKKRISEKEKKRRWLQANSEKLYQDGNGKTLLMKRVNKRYEVIQRGDV